MPLDDRAHSTLSRDLAALQRLREREDRRDRARPLGAGCQRLARIIKRRAREMGDLGDAWAELCPPDLAPRTKPLGVSRGVLSIGITNDADRYAIDRFLRSGGTRQLAARSPATLRRVKLVRINPAEVAAPREADR